MEFFEIFELTPSFLLDEADLKKRFYQNSKRFHPDFHTQADEATQQQILLKSSINNKAYPTLLDEYSRIGYILKNLGLIGEGIKHDLPQDFLMEMMEVNEQLMEFQFDPDPEQLASAKSRIEAEMQQLREGVSEAMEEVIEPAEQAESLEQIKDYYLKKKYLLRMLENLDRFAGAKDEDPFV